MCLKSVNRPLHTRRAWEKRNSQQYAVRCAKAQRARPVQYTLLSWDKEPSLAMQKAGALRDGSWLPLELLQLHVAALRHALAAPEPTRAVLLGRLGVLSHYSTARPAQLL